MDSYDLDQTITLEVPLRHAVALAFLTHTTNLERLSYSVRRVTRPSSIPNRYSPILLSLIECVEQEANGTAFLNGRPLMDQILRQIPEDRRSGMDRRQRKWARRLNPRTGGRGGNDTRKSFGRRSRKGLGRRADDY